MKVINENVLNEYIDDIITNHKIICIDTDTIYGIVCSAFDKISVEKIYDIKNRNKNKPIGIFINDLQKLTEYFDINEKEFTFIKNNLTKPTTFIVDDKKNLFTHLTNNKKIAFRIPKNNTINNLINYINAPLAQTSCNISNENDYKTFEEINTKLGDKIDYFVEQNGDIIKTDLASTIIDLTIEPYKIIRQGR